MLVDKTGTVCWCLEWTPHKVHGFKIRSVSRQVDYVGTLLDVLYRIVELTEEYTRTVDVVAIEQLYIPPRKNRAFLRSVESRGVLAEGVGILKPSTYAQPTPLQWRKAMLGTGVRNRKQAKACALNVVSKVPGITLPQSDHVAEAYCIAQYGRRFVVRHG